MQNQQKILEGVSYFLACQQAKVENDFLIDEDSQAFIENLPQ